MTGQRFDSVWDAIEDTPAEAASMRRRADLMIAIQEAVDSWGTEHRHVARRLGVTVPRLSDLLRGRIDRFALDDLLDLAERAGLDVRIEVSRPAA